MKKFSGWFTTHKTSGREKPAERFFLSTFLVPRLAEDTPVLSSDDWEKALGEDPQSVTERFIKERLIKRADLAVHLDKKFTADDLGEMLRERGLSVPPRKDAMILYLIRTREDEMWQAVTGLHILVCTDQGVKLVKEYLEDFKKGKEKPIEKNYLITRSQTSTLLKWIALAAAAGIIGNRADDALLLMVKEVDDILESEGNTPQVNPGTATPKPTSTEPVETLTQAPPEEKEPDDAPDLIPIETPTPTTSADLLLLAETEIPASALETAEISTYETGQEQPKSSPAKAEENRDKLDGGIFLVPIPFVVADDIMRQQSLEEPTLDGWLEMTADTSDNWESDFSSEAIPEGELPANDEDADFDHDGFPDMDFDIDSPPDGDMG